MKVCLIILFAITPLLGHAQGKILMSFDDFQIVENPSTSIQKQLCFPVRNSVLVMGGLNDLDGMNSYFNIFGSKLIIDSRKITSNGEHTLVLSREGGRNLNDLFSTLSVKLIPIY